MIQVGLGHRHIVDVVLLVVLILGFDDAVGVVHNLLIVGTAVGHGSTPQVDVGCDGIDGIAGDVAPVAPVVQTVATRLHDVLAGLVQVVEALLQHFARGALCNGLNLTVVLVGLADVRHIAEGANQIEVAERAQSQHLGANHVVVALSELRVFGHHLGCMAQYDVAVVDDLIEIGPRAIAHRRQQVDGTHVVEVGAAVVAGLHQFVGAVGTPHDGSLLNAAAEHAVIGSVDHLLNV